MTTERLNVIIDGSQGALLRVLGTIERRGWQVEALETERLDDRAMRLELELLRLPWHGAHADVLKRHIEKLVCVRSVDERAAIRLACPMQAGAEHTIAMGAVS